MSQHGVRFPIQCLVLIAGLMTAGPVGAQPSPALNLESTGDTHTPTGRQRFLDRTSVLLLAGLGSAALLSRSLENQDQAARLLDHPILDPGIDLADRYGEGGTLGLAALGLLTLGRVTDDDRLAASGKDLAASLLTAWAATWALKVIVNEERPNGGPYSFPSGHTATAFAAAPVFHRHFGPRAGYASYALAALTGLARMEDRKHRLADILAGAAIGIAAGRSSAGGGALRLAFPRKGYGVGLAYRF